MALEAGGYAEKLGNRYEANWVAYQLIRLLEEKISWVTVEPIGDDEVGVDVIVGRTDGSREYHQCKAGIGNSEHWTLSQLNQSKILQNASFQINRGATEFHLVSPLTSKKISDLSDSALNSNMSPMDFLNHQINSSQERKKDFHSLCEHLGLDVTVELDVHKAVLFLQKFKITPYIIQQHTKNELEDKATTLFLDSPIKLLQFLKNYPVEFNKLRKQITSHELLQDLKASGFETRFMPDDQRISAVVNDLSTEFEESIRPFLISNELIKREELSSTLASAYEYAVTLIRAEAGIGKSSLLYELHRHLTHNNVISVPIRLDRRRPENSADSFGQSLGFPYSPVLSLGKYACEQKVIIILDQLDAIRWTGSHSNSALHVCQSIVRQVIALRKEGADISIVLASRDFDLNEDIALASWLSGISEHISEIYLSTLDESVVDALVSPYEKYATLPTEKKSILQIPLWLGIYLTIANRTNAAPSFNNKLELVKNFWNDRLSQIDVHHVTHEDARRLIDEIVVLMTNRSQLSISESSITLGSKHTLSSLISVGLLTEKEHRISFRHQALFDYQVGIKLFQAGCKSPEMLLSEIGGYDEQTLTKREHLKYALNMLLDLGQSEFCACVGGILFSKNIRFHLKFLVLNSLKELRTIKAPSRKLINKITEQPDLLMKFLSTSCYKNHHVLEYLITNGTITKWLRSSDDKLIEATIRLLSSISEIKPELVVDVLSPFVGLSDDWNSRVYNGLPWNIENDSDDMFELRKKLLKLNCQGNFIDWKALSKKYPQRALSLVEIMLEHYQDILCKPKYSSEVREHKNLTQRDNWSPTELNEILGLSETIADKVISVLLKKIDNIVEKQEDGDAIYTWLHKDGEDDYEIDSSITTGVFSVIEKSGKQLESKPTTLLKLLEPYLTHTNPIMTHMVAKLLLNLPVKYSDVVIGWLLKNTESRLSCGNTYREPIWVLPGKLIERFSGYCSLDKFSELESKLYGFRTRKKLENIKWILEARRGGLYCSYWGEPQYFLLPKLASNRTSDNTKQLIRVLERKFASYTTSDFCSVFNTTGGVITSPLPVGNRLSDKTWASLILTPKDAFRSKNWKQVGNDVITESSIEQFSNSLDTAVRNEPIRFANFALSLPQDIDNKYISAFFSGLSESDCNKVNDDYKENWQLCPDELVEQVIFHFYHKNCEHSLVRLLDSRATNLSDKATNLLFDLARNAKDPEPDKLNVWNAKKGNNVIDASAKSLHDNAINCVRGIAYFGIARIFWSSKNYALEHLTIIDNAINDSHPAVNISAIELLKPILNYDNDYAHTKFLELCNKDLRICCGYGAQHFFNQGFEGAFQAQYVHLVMNMMTSTHNDVRKEAGRQVYARWFFNELFQEQINLVLDGDEVLKSGCASVISQFLREDQYHDRIEKIEAAYQQLINDESEEILKRIGGCVRGEHYWSKHNSNRLFSFFVQSKAAKYCLFELFHVLEEFSGSILELSSPILDLVKNITNNANDDKTYRQRHIHESSLLSVLQRLYDEATEDEDVESISTCLDIWDELLQSGLYSAISAVNELDKGLLT